MRGQLPIGSVLAGAIDAQLTVDGTDGEDGSLHLTGVWLSPEATTLQLQGTLGGRTVSVSVPAT